MSFKMYYQPTLTDGTPIQLPWQLRSFFTNVSWPLIDNPNLWMRILNYVVNCVALLSFVVAFEAGVRFSINNMSDISVGTEAIATLVIYNDSILRIFNMSLRKESFKRFFRIFYAKIYVNKDEDEQMYKSIQKSLMPINVYAVFYLASIIIFCMSPIVMAILYNTRLLPHMMTFHYGLENPLAYGWTLLQLTCNGLCATMFLTGETCLLGNFTSHLCARFEMMQHELHESAFLLAKFKSSEVAGIFHKTVDMAIEKTNEFNKFAVQMNELYSFQIFVMISHSTLMLCVLIFQVSASEVGSAKFINYVIWMAGKILELIIIGALGSRLITTTDNTSSMFYHCNWEVVVMRSTNQNENVKLMKKIRTAILLYQKPIELNGFGFFNVSLDTAASLIRGAGSYFTVLQTFA